MFKNGRTNVHVEGLSGRPSLVTDELTVKINEKIRGNRHFTITELSLDLHKFYEVCCMKCSEKARLPQVLFKIGAENHDIRPQKNTHSCIAGIPRGLL
ncbi:hypothetical protein AVEN_24088-1 [Araneus ventricosus]|uniref:Uncharacterized protein n=1 Tax=Araneus ventricosus TaxID=182803 RepID=A0A4Y2MNW9_ARAVE|nr:hypothetical protein AVEN_131432-1 [Araneus ventricosus]GBN28380.1 hypothetical protein AVEN_24088-1 [Araneus ventricosus]